MRKLAQGGMGAVYEVRQNSTNRARALKVLLPGLVSDAKQVERFVQEARIGARIASDHVVEVIDAGVDQDTHTPWLVMEFLEGETLAERTARLTRFTPAETLQVMEQVCHALTHAHAAGVVHRDLKPENIFVAQGRRADASWTVKVLDFGIARWIEDGRHATKNSQVIGTPAWMAPEQLDTGTEITPATDVWALGLIVFQMLTGTHYWHAMRTANSGVMPLLAEISAGASEPPSLRTEGTLPVGFDAWFLQCLAPAPAARFHDAGACISALRAVMSVHSTLAAADTVASDPHPVGLSHNRVPPRVRHRFVALGLAGITLSVGVGFWIVRSNLAKHPASAQGEVNAATVPLHGEDVVQSPVENTASDVVRVLPSGGQLPVSIRAGVEPAVLQLATFSWGERACALLDGGTVRCWGSNMSWNADQKLEAQVPFQLPGVDHALSVAVGIQHACVLLMDRTLTCWGSNIYGELGTGEHLGTPGLHPFEELSGVRSVALGRLVSCVVQHDRTVACWGDNSYGTLGVPNIEASATSVRVPGPSMVTEVSAGTFGACALTESGTVWCWGRRYNSDDGPTAPRVVQNTAVAGISVGDSAACARMEDGHVRCWGKNNDGQLGGGNSERTDAVVTVKRLQHVSQVSVGRGAVCAVQDGSVWCWGDPEHGSLFRPEGGQEVAEVPVQVPGLSDVVEVHMGFSFACVLTRARRVLCWGTNSHGSLGSGTSGNNAVPTPPAW